MNDGVPVLRTPEVALERHGHPDIILMDIGLPGMDGLEAAVRLKQQPHTAGIPVIAVSAFGSEGDGRRALTAGCADFYAEPVDMPAPLQAIRAALAARSDQDAESARQYQG